MIGLRSWIGRCDILFVTLDTLRYDVAVEALRAGRTPALAGMIPGGQWEKRHTPGSFTFAAHQAFFAGFLPTPADPKTYPRLFAASFAGSETIGEETFVYEESNWVSALSARGYHTICVGGVGFFNKRNAIGRVLPDLFSESHWSPELGVTEYHSTRNQVHVALQALDRQAPDRRVLLFMNISALHQPNRIYLPGATEDTRESQAAALAYADSQLGPLFAAMRRRAPLLSIVCSDHGDAFGENGYVGHRSAHEVVWNVPYAEALFTEPAP